MEKAIELNPQELQIQELLDRYLSSLNVAESAGPHVEGDLLVAFVEGRINERESNKVVSHLVDCGFCRSTTAELIRFETEFSEYSEPVIEHSEPSRISEVLSGLFSKVFGSTEGAVFAHEDGEKSQKEDEDKSDEEPN